MGKAKYSARVSVITPVYNGEKYLRRAIDSVLAQTKPAWELIVVDDGSTDSTPQILDEYSDSRIIKIFQDNYGKSVARNVALNSATGEYIAFLDADDFYLPSALADLTDFLDYHPDYAVVYSDGYFCDQSEKRLFRLSEHRIGIYTGNILERVVSSPSVITVPVCTLTRRAVIEQYRARFDERLLVVEDWDFWIQLARVARFGYLDKQTCMYRVHETNTTWTYGFQKRLEDLVRARMKILNAEWFEKLSALTRRQFFYYLLIDLLRDNPTSQHEILESNTFRNLPASDQADLWRLVGAEYFIRNTGEEFAMDCLRRASDLSPRDLKSRYLIWVNEKLGSLVVTISLRLWRRIIGSASIIRTLGHRRPKPAPKVLALIPD